MWFKRGASDEAWSPEQGGSNSSTGLAIWVELVEMIAGGRIELSVVVTRTLGVGVSDGF